MTMHRCALAVLTAGLALSAAPAPAGACGKGEILYRDNFAWADASWQLDPKFAAVESGALTMKLAAKQEFQAVNESGYYRDANVCVDISFDAASLETTFAMLLFWNDAPNFYAVVVTNGQVGLARQIRGEALWPAALRPAKALGTARGQWNTLELQTRDKTVRLLVNGTQAASVAGVPPANGGKLTLAGVNQGGGAAVVKFRNFIVESGSAPGIRPAGR